MGMQDRGGIHMEMLYNVTGDAHKELVAAIGKLGLQEFHQRRC